MEGGRLIIGTQIGVSIVTYNSGHIFETLDNFCSQIFPSFSCRIYVFDNCSDKSFQDQLKKYASDNIQIHFSDNNHGFGYGHNYNIDVSREEFMLICNPDIIVEKNSFSILHKYLSKHKSTMVAPKVLYPNGDVQFLVRERLDLFDYVLRFVPSKTIKRLFRSRLASFECQGLSDNPQQVNFVSGCFMYTRRSDLIDVGGFDDRFFMYFEDNDLCQRFREKGKVIIYHPNASVIHFYGKEAHKSFKIFKIFIGSMVRYFNKWGWNIF